RHLAGRLDPEDVVQSAFRTFFRRSARGEFRIGSSGQLWRLLVKITVLKTWAKNRYHSAGRRDVRAENRAATDDALRTALTQEPGPPEVAALVDLIQTILHGLPNPFGEMLELRLREHSVEEIAERFGVSRQTVYRKLDTLQRRLARALEQAG